MADTNPDDASAHSDLYSYSYTQRAGTDGGRFCRSSDKYASPYCDRYPSSNTNADKSYTRSTTIISPLRVGGISAFDRCNMARVETKINISISIMRSL